MARGKSKFNITAKIRDRWIEDWEKLNAKGQKYVPFIDPRDIKSDGSKGRIPDYENDGQDKRVLSNNERLFYFLLLFDNNILWIKEQFPLLPLVRSRAIAKFLGLGHPKYPYSSLHAVMTTDFYCGKLDGSEVAYSIKDDEQLEKLTERQKKNIKNKEKIQRAFWESKGVTYHLIHSSSFKKTYFARNLGKLAQHLKIPFELELIRVRWLKCFEQALKSTDDSRLSALIQVTSSLAGIDYQQSIVLFQHCVWHKLILANLHIQLRYEKRASLFNLKVAEYE